MASRLAEEAFKDCKIKFSRRNFRLLLSGAGETDQNVSDKKTGRNSLLNVQVSITPRTRKHLMENRV